MRILRCVLLVALLLMSSSCALRDELPHGDYLDVELLESLREEEEEDVHAPLASLKYSKFRPIAPTPCASGWTPVDYQFVSFGKDPNDKCHEGCYGNNIDYTRRIVANDYVHKIGLCSPSYFETEHRSDYVLLGRGGEYGSNVQHKLTGELSPPPGPTNWTDIDLHHQVFTAALYPNWWTKYEAYVRFKTDKTLADYLGFKFYGARACGDCSYDGSFVASNHYLHPGERYDGLLLGSGDVVFFYHGSAGPAVGHNYLLGPVLPSSGTDFDVYVKCGSRPTRDSYDYGSTSEDSEEFIHIAPSEDYCQGQAIYVAVHSAGGKGSFYLIRSLVKPQHIHTSVTAGSDYGGNKKQILDCLRQAMRFFYHVTEGQSVIRSIIYYHNNGCQCGSKPCQICFTKEVDPIYAGRCFAIGMRGGKGKPYSAIRLYDRGTSAHVLTHEMAHCFFNQRDEYELVGGKKRCRCGHTLMGPVDKLDLCTDLNHGRDAHPDASAPGKHSGWYYVSCDCLCTKSGEPVSFIPSLTPEPAPPNHGLHDFSGYLTVKEAP